MTKRLIDPTIIPMAVPVGINELLEDMVAKGEIEITVEHHFTEDRRSHWNEDPDHPSEEWRSESFNDDTRNGYSDWVSARRDELGTERRVVNQGRVVIYDPGDYCHTCEQVCEKLDDHIEGCSGMTTNESKRFSEKGQQQ